jgi:polysaccharide biosynthesis protein PelC
MRRTHFWTVGALAVLVGLAVACAAKKSAEVTFHEATMDFSMIRTVAVMPFANMSTVQTADERVRDVFMTMLQATGQMYVLPIGEVQRGLSRVEIQNPVEPSPQDVVALSKVLECDAVITGAVLEYGEARSGSASANYITMGVQMMEAKTGRLVWSAQSTEGGITAADRMFGGGGEPMNVVTAEAVNDLLDKLYKAK